MVDDDRVAIHEATTGFLEDRDDGEQALETVLEVDSRLETWTFKDVEVDSGTFGELVSRGIVEKADGEYHVADCEAVQAALTGEDVTAGGGPALPDLENWSPTLGVWGDIRALAGLVGALCFLFAMRLTQYGSVFQGEDVVSPGNDPYYYRYWMDELLSQSTNPGDFGLLAEMPQGAIRDRPLTHALNWWFAALLGGDQAAADTVAAWLPVVATLALGVVVYALAVVVTRDPRVGIASVVLLAVAPVHAVYTQVGFLEHRLHQYFWLGVTLLALAWLAMDLTRRREQAGTREAIRGHLRSPITWVWALMLGFTLGISAHLWGGSSLLFMPLAAYIGLKAALDARDGVSPTLANLPLLVGLGLGSTLSAWLYVAWDWQMGFVAFTPAMVLGGALCVFLLGELWRTLEFHVGGLVVLEAALTGLGIYLFRQFRPADWADAQTRADDLLLREGYTESVSLFTPEYMVLFGPLVQLGISFYLGVAVMGWAIWLLTRRYEPAWLLLTVYAAVLMVLAGIQIRFAAQFMIPIAVLGGLGFVYLLSAIDLSRRPVPFRSTEDRRVAADGGEKLSFPERQKVVYLLGIGVLVCGMGLLFVPGLSGQIAYSESEHAATQAIDDHATEWNRTYPENFVLSAWGENRMYNYFVSGESERYGYARSNFGEFRSSDDPDGYYGQFEGRVGYVILTDLERDVTTDTAQRQLLGGLGTGGEGEPLAHYQLLYADEDRSTVAFAVVPGATINATGESGETVAVSTEVNVFGESFTYETEGKVGNNGRLEVTVPYAGEYTLGERTVTVNEGDVINGREVVLEG
ncbi:MFS transporter [Natronosalvus rutilus]|uniref:dolichyl-phosphooligosaccharide-protein glycotransferase n=1 Tax=Natronosalvus rutilus TaxID=2953753 RepID=A0A9E7SUK3_9EURY|nr:MFS transporter [Natronosalvus rutilus]UTF54879.1 MFS transporter [Natronosalvus rutilus]